MSSSDHFHAASALFVDTVASVPTDAWTRPGLGAWDVRGLVGHTSRALVTVIDYLAAEAPPAITIDTAADYYAAIDRTYADPGAVERRGVEAGAALGDDPLAAVRDLRERAIAAVAAQPAERLVAIGGMGLRLDEYLRTRVLELVVHSLDIARAIDVPAQVPVDLVESTAALAVGVAARAGTGEQLLLALTGRTPLPPGFSVL